LFWATGDWVSTSSSSRVGYYATTVYSCLLAIPILVVLVVVFGASTALSSTSILILVLASAGFLAAYLFAYRGYQIGPLSVVAPIAYTSPAVAVVLTVVVLGARLTEVEVVPLVAIMVGVILLSTKFSELRSRKDREGSMRNSVALGIVSAFSFSFVFLVLSTVVPEVGYLVPVLILKAGGAFFGFAIAPALKKDVKPTKGRFGPLIWLVAILDTVGYLFLGAGLASAGISLPLVIMASGIGGFFLVCYAMAFRKEKPELNQLIGIAISIVGVATLLYLTA
jgi:transporter family protein